MKNLLLITAAAGLVGLGAAAVEAQTLGQVQAQASGVLSPGAAQEPNKAIEAHKSLEAEASVQKDKPQGYVYGDDDTRVQGDATAKGRVGADARARSRAATVSSARTKAETPAADVTVKSKDRSETEVPPPRS